VYPEGRLDVLPLGPHQQQEMRQRVLKAQEQLSGKISTRYTGEAGVDDDTVRATFFAELCSVLTTTAALATKVESLSCRDVSDACFPC
jgi:hypothetical protein